MNISDPFGDTTNLELTDAGWDELAERLQEFSDAWEAGASAGVAPEPPDPRKWLPDGDSALRFFTLIEFIKLDMEYRSRFPESWKSLEQYRQEWPELCVSGEMPADLVYEEYQLRKKMGEATDDYQARFPGAFSALTRLINDETAKSTAMFRPGAKVEFDVGDRIDDFDLLTRLGKGAFATVFLARQNSMQRLVALKISADQGQEPQMLAQLDHPHIVRVFDHRVITNPPARLMYMQHVAGGTLQEAFTEARGVAGNDELTGRHLVEAVDRLLNIRGETIPVQSENRRRLARSSWAQVVSQIGMEIALALDYAHDRNVLHRDLKPANVLLDKDCHVKLVDFNISFCSKLDGATPAAYFGGSLSYMSPEQLEACSPDHDREPHELDGRSDIYSVGVLVFELLTGKRPFVDEMKAGNWAGTMDTMIRDRGPGLTDESAASLEPYSPVLVNSIKRCLNSDVDQRFQSSETLHRNLSWARNPQSDALFNPRTDLFSRFAWWTPYWTVGLLTMAISAAAVLFIWTYNLDRSVPDGATDFFLTAVNVINPFLFTLGGLLIYLIVRPVSRCIRALKRKQPVTREQLHAAIQRNLNLGHYIGIMSWSEWMFGGLIYPVALSLRGFSLSPQSWTDFLLSHCLAGLIAAAYVFWVVTWTALYVYHPRLLEASLRYDENTNWSARHAWLERAAGFYHVLAIAVPIIGIAWLVLYHQAGDQDKGALTVLSVVSLLGLILLVWVSQQVRKRLEVLKSFDPPSDEDTWGSTVM
ncbi:MAG: serine/threonine-protein kinase [Pirellulaceae bacterium]